MAGPPDLEDQIVEVSVARITSVSAGTGRKTRIGLASGTRPSLQLARSPMLQEMPSSVCSKRRVCTIDECRYRLCGITVAPRMPIAM